MYYFGGVIIGILFICMYDTFQSAKLPPPNYDYIHEAFENIKTQEDYEKLTHIGLRK